MQCREHWIFHSRNATFDVRHLRVTVIFLFLSFLFFAAGFVASVAVVCGYFSCCILLFTFHTSEISRFHFRRTHCTHTQWTRAKKKIEKKKTKKKNLFTDKSGSCVIHLHTAFYFLIAIRYTERQCRSEISLFFVNIHRFGPQKPTHNSESTVKRTKIYLKMWEKSRKKSIDCVPFDVRQCINLAGSRVTACVQRRRENHAPTVVNKFTIHSIVRLFFLPFLTHTGARFPPE